MGLIHKFKLNQLNIVLDVASNSIYVLEEIDYDVVDFLEVFNQPFLGELLSQNECPREILQKLPQYSFNEVNSVYLNLRELYKDGLIFSSDNEAKESFDKPLVTPIKSMCLNVAQSCNMRCKYCFAGDGEYNQAGLMPFEIAKLAVDFLVNNSGDRQTLEIDFFGGEPLLNFDVIKQTVEYANAIKDKTFNFTVTTNGVLLDDDKINYINEHMSNVVLSLDGRREIHDNMRSLKSGKGSYDIIIERFKRLVEKRKLTGKDYYVRGTFTNHNLDFSKDIFELKNIGFEHLSIEPVIADLKEEYALRNLNIPAMFKEYETLADKIYRWERRNKVDFDFFHFNIEVDDDEHSCCVAKRLKGCGSGNEYVAITPNGDIFPCHQFIGLNENEFKMGNLVDGTFNADLKNTFASCHVFMKKECENCWAKYYCSGGCNALNFQFEQNIFTPNKFYCIVMKKRIECALWLKAIAKIEQINADSYAV
ncbi:thioether cross-link-forming SCIFF peptide maturase [Clostridia bacterium]|nr:thioether cross-link-forming SCIFF peptide maturase [Clostridia bacterium]